MISKFNRRWMKLWMRYAGISPLGRLAARLAGWYAAPFYGRIQLSKLHPRGYISPKAEISHPGFTHDGHVFIDDRVLVYRDREGGEVRLAAGVHLHRETIIQTGKGGTVEIGPYTHIQPRCQFSAYMSPIYIGAYVEIAPACAFYPYDHNFAPGELIRRQPLKTKGGIFIGDGVWVGYGVIVLDGVHIGDDAVIGAGAVVTKDIPEQAVAAGNPAKILAYRNEIKQNPQIEKTI